MGTVASTARIKLNGFNTEGVDAYSPLEDQVALTYRAAYHYADANGFQPYVHRGVPGRRGPMVMKRITDILFDSADSGVRDKINGLVTQVLRKTDAAVCVKHPPPDRRHEVMPEWFVADRMPSNLTIVALSHAHRDTDGPPATKPSARVVETHAERKVTPEQAGENLPPGEVTVRKADTNPKVLDAFKEQQERIAEKHRQLLDEVYRTVEAHAPIAAPELKHLLPHLMDGPSGTAVQDSVRELAEAGRLVSRTEEDAERLIRGGGSMPKGKRVKLWAVAPGPVPTRTAMPEGVPTRKGAAQWETEKKERIDAWCDKVLEELGRPYPKGTNRPRSVGRLGEVTGLDEPSLRVALDRLIRLELIYENNHTYYLTDRKRGTYEGRAVHQATKEDTVPSTPPVTPTLPAPTDQGELVRQIHMAVEALAQRAGNSDETLRLTERVAELEASNEKLRRQVTALRGALAALEE